MEPSKSKVGSPEIRAALDSIAFILTSFHLKPGILLAIHNGAVFYDGEAALAPKEWLSLPGVVGIMHPHDKARLDAALNKAARLDRRKGPLPQNLVEAQVALNKPDFTALEDRIVASNRALAAPYESTPAAPDDQTGDIYRGVVNAGGGVLTGRLQKPDWPFKSPQVQGDPINENYADPDPRFGADDAGKAGWGNKTDGG